MAKNAWNVQALAKAVAAFSALTMVVFWLLGTAGIYMSAVEAMTQWHIFFNLTLLGLIGGVAEAAIWGYIGGYVFGWLYNRWA
tara:strand:+ start:7963 stop:8211 length:249 start_codon:yes stop_codon:yes gene_type:complete